MRTRDLKIGLTVYVRARYGAARTGFIGVVVGWFTDVETNVLVAFDKDQYSRFEAFIQELHNGSDWGFAHDDKNLYTLPVRLIQKLPLYEDEFNNWV